MKVRNVLACAAAVLALAGCNKNKQESNAVANEKVTITQANADGEVTDADREHKTQYEQTWFTMLKGVEDAVAK